MSVGCSFAMLANSAVVAAQGAAQEPKEQRVTVVTRDGGEAGATFVIGQDGVPRQIGPAAPGVEVPLIPDVVIAGTAPAGNYAFAASEMSFDSRVVKNAPYSAEAVTEVIQTLSDGNRIVRRSTTQIYRDSEGRTRREQAVTAIGPWATANQGAQRIYINDPVEGVNFILDPRSQTARKMSSRFNTARIAPSVTPAAGTISTAPTRLRLSGGGLQGSATKRVQPSYPAVAKAANASGSVQVQVTIDEAGKVIDAQAISGHPLLREAAVEAARQWEFNRTEVEGRPVRAQGTLTFNFTLDTSERQVREVAGAMVAARPVASTTRVNVETRKEDLGKQVIEGVEAEGTRSVSTIPAGAIGNERPIEIISERWYSPELQTVVMTRHSDPRSGETVYRLTNIVRSEPSPYLFQVPSEYTVQDDEINLLLRRKIESEIQQKKNQQ